VTETQILCNECGDTGFVPPFMDRCSCKHKPGVPSGDSIATITGDIEVGPPVYTGTSAAVAWVDYDHKSKSWKTVPAPANADEILADAKARHDGPRPLVGSTAIAAAVAAAPKKKIGAKPGEKVISAAQVNLLDSLVAERDAAHPVVAEYLQELSDHTDAGAMMSAKNASQWITKIMAVGKDATKPAAEKSNKYDGSCKDCGGPVPAGAGVIRQVVPGGKWTTFHKPGNCLNALEAAALMADKVTEPGLYRFVTSLATEVYRVRWNQSKTRLYGELVVPHAADDTDGEEGHGHVEFLYNGKALSFLRASDKLTWQEAREFGALYGTCVACGRSLEDPRSVVQGYGPKCADNNGWPTVTAKQAKAIIAEETTWEAVISDLGVLTP
jgi:hypothetical protein